MYVFSNTNIGLSRAENQDRVRAVLIDENTAFAVVCDGMGGENAGSEASERAINIIVERFTKVYKNFYDSNAIRNLLISSVTTANAVVHDLAMSCIDKKGMGTTCVAVLRVKNRIHVISIGDSRVYLIDDGIMQVTKDHSIVAQLYEKGEITKAEIKTHPQRNYITKAIGVTSGISPDYFELDVSENAVILLCSDGLSNYCDDKDMLDLTLNNNIEDLPDLLIEKALKNGGNDNITVAVIK